MPLTIRLAFIIVLILASAYFALSEISLTGSNKVRLAQMAEAGDKRAQEVLDIQNKPGPFFSVIQIGTNAIAILGGIIGEAFFTDAFLNIFKLFLPSPYSHTTAFCCSFLLITFLFIIFADLLPKRIGLAEPEKISVRVVGSMQFLIKLLKPLVWFLTAISNSLMRLLGFSTQNSNNLTSEDIVVTVEAGAAEGLIAPTEQAAIENVMDLESRLVTSAMTTREFISYFILDESYENISKKIAASTHNKFLVCDEDVDHVIGYVDSKDILKRVIKGQTFNLADQNCLSPVAAIPDSLSLSEVLDVFKTQKTDFAVVVNEYALTVGVVTLNDVMSTVMGDFLTNQEDSQIVERAEGSWLMEGSTPIVDVQRVFDLESFPEEGTYETLAGFMMYMLRKVPKLTDNFTYRGYRFEVVDLEGNRIDQVLATRLAENNPCEESSSAERIKN